MILLELENVSKEFSDKKADKTKSAIRNISLKIHKGRTTALMGANGSGKTTIIRIFSELEKPSTGKFKCSSKPKLEVMFQDFRSSLFPWFNVFQNLKFPFSHSEDKVKMIKEMISKLIPSLDLNAYPSQLSGGELQAVALIRALSVRTDLLLLDEPFGSFDIATHARARELCREAIQKDRVGTLVFSTHSLEDVVSLAQDVIILKGHPGRVYANLSFENVFPQANSEDYARAIQVLREKVTEAISSD